MLLFAQPATRIVRLTIDDVIHAEGGGVSIRFGQPLTPVPEPFATLLLQATAHRGNPQTATNPGARWLFPGRRGGQPLHASHLAELVRDLVGIPAVAGWTAALRQLVPQALPRHRQAPGATTTAPSPGSPPRRERPGAATPRAATARSHQPE
jgi:hypothetical protein